MGKRVHRLVPVMVRGGAGKSIAGHVYGRFGEKAVLALRYIAERTPFGQGQGWNGDPATLEATLGLKRTVAMAKLQELTGLDSVAATQALWHTYHPHYVWIPFALVGVVAAVGLWIFGRMAKRWADMNAWPGYFMPCSPAKPQRVRRYVLPTPRLRQAGRQSQAPVSPG